MVPTVHRKVTVPVPYLLPCKLSIDPIMMDRFKKFTF